MDHKDWSKVNETLDISPFVYGRHLQIVIDLSKVDQQPDRRSRIWSVVEKMTPLQIMNEALAISIKIIDNILKKNKIDNGLYDLVKEMPNQEGLNDNEKLYLGRCFQFLLDTDRKKFQYDDLIKLLPKEIRDQR